MITFTKNYTELNDLQADMIKIGYRDEVIGDAFEEGTTYDNIDVITSDILYYVNNNRPGINNTSYPNCISFSINSYGFRYMKDNIGFGINTRINRKTNDVTYVLTISFNKPAKFLTSNSIFAALSGDDTFKMEERK